MKYTEIPRSLIYNNYSSIDDFINVHSLNETLIDNMNNIVWMRENDFEARALKCMNTAYYLYMVMKMTKRPKYQTEWCYRNAVSDKNDGGLSQLVTMAIMLQLIEHGNKEWAKANEDFVKRIKSDLSMRFAVRNEDAGLGIIIPQRIDFGTIAQTIEKGIDKVSPLPDKLFKPLPILEGIRNTWFEPNLIVGLNYIIEQIRALKNRDEQQLCVDTFMHHFKHIVNNQWEIQNTFDRIEVLCKECDLTIPDRILEEKEKEEEDECATNNIDDDKDIIISELRTELEQMRSLLNEQEKDIKPANSYEKIIFFATVLSAAYDDRFTNQQQLSEFICLVCGGKPSTFQPRISKLADMADKNNYDDEVINAAKKLVDKLKLIPKKDDKDNPKIRDFIKSIISEFGVE